MHNTYLSPHPLVSPRSLFYIENAVVETEARLRKQWPSSVTLPSHRETSILTLYWFRSHGISFIFYTF